MRVLIGSQGSQESIQKEIFWPSPIFQRRLSNRREVPIEIAFQIKDPLCLIGGFKIEELG
jgi:hypothetical protein